MATFPELNIVAVATSHNKGRIGAPLDAMQTHLLPGALRFCRGYAAFVSGAAKALFIRTCQCFDL